MKFSRHKSARRARLQLSLLQVLLLVVAGVVLAVATFLVARPDIAYSGLRALEQRWGYVLWQSEPALMDRWTIATGSVLRGLTTDIPRFPELVLDVPFGDMRQIYAKREEALRRGILIQGEDDFVRGSMRFNGETIPVDLRLKGDWNDHLAGRKWSFRVHVRGDQHLLGMRRFSLQSPRTRGFQSEVMFFEALRRYDVLAPRYTFVELTLNGDDLGIMAVEEFFAKELLEHRGRREGVIMRFNESLAWSARDAITGQQVGWGGAFDDYRNATIDPFGSGRVQRSPTLLKQLRVAEGLLRGFVDGTLQASQVFDVEKMGAFLATADLFGSWHTAVWHNMRFYLNPVTLRLEPVAFDVDLQEALMDETSITQRSRIGVDMLRDPLIWERYRQVLSEWADALANSSLEADMRAVEDRYWPTLRTEFRMLPRFPLGYLQPRSAALNAWAATVPAGGSIPTPDELYFLEREPEQYPVLAHFGILQRNGSEWLRIDTAIPKLVRITDVRWIEIGGTRSLPAVAVDALPLQLPARAISGPGERVELALVPVPFEMGNRSDWQLEVTAAIQGRNWTRQFMPLPTVDALEAVPLPQLSLASLLETFPFLVLDAAAATIRIPSGDWSVDSTLALPPGYALQVEAGTRLTFGPDALFVVRGPVMMAGRPDAGIELRPQARSTWPGMVVLEAAKPSLLQHVVFRDTHSVATDLWTLMGGVNFYASEVTIEDTLFDGSHGEDALNIINSEFSLQRVTMRNTASDAFDADFSTGSVADSRFIDIGLKGGGDAIDISGSRIEVRDSVFENIGDKALSVGEGSTMTAGGLSMRGVSTAAAAKDGSSLELSRLSVDGAGFAVLTAYMKKPEYGPAMISASDLDIRDAATLSIVQTGSRVTVDGQAQPTRNVDVDALYETIMRPGLRRGSGQ